MFDIRQAAHGRPTERVRAFLRSEDGGATIWNLSWLLGFAVMAGVSIDSTNGWRTKTGMQSTADAAALAAALDLWDWTSRTTTASSCCTPPDEAAVKTMAQNYVQKNMALASNGQVLDTANDVVLGTWDVAARTFDPAGPYKNAVQVTLRRTQASGNPLPTQMLHTIGLNSWNVQTTAIAIRMNKIDCWNDGFIAATSVETGSNNTYVDDLCIHGQDYVKVGSDTVAEPGVVISMLDPNDFIQGGNNTGVDDALMARDLLPPLPGEITDLYNLMKTGQLDPRFPMHLPEGQTWTLAPSVEVLEETHTLQPFHIYVATKEAKLGSDKDIRDVIIVSKEKITIGSSNSLQNVMLVSGTSNIELGSYNTVGASNYCDSGLGYVRMFAKDLYKGGSNTTYSGVQIVAGNGLDVGSNLESATGIAGQSGGWIKWGSDEHFGGCGASFVESALRGSRLVY